MPSGPRPSGCRSAAAETEPAAPWRECPAAASLLSQPATGGGGGMDRKSLITLSCITI